MYKKIDRITYAKNMTTELYGTILVINLNSYICIVHI
jgi:hypothetical protein